MDHAAASPSFAGRFETFEAFERGVFDARRAVGLPDLPAGMKLVGQDGFYSDVRAAERGYEELRHAMRSVSAPPKAPGPAPPADGRRIDPAAQPQTALSVSQILSGAGITPQEVYDAWVTLGELTDAQYAAIAGVDKALTRQVVDQFIERQTGDLRLEAGKLTGAPGGFDELMRWVSDHYSKKERGDVQVRLADPAQCFDALAEINGRLAEAAAPDPRPPQPEPPPLPQPPPPPGGFNADSPRSDFLSTIRAAQRGDAAAMDRIRETPADVFGGMMSGD